ncbi:MAG: M28 family peptidase [Bacteroidales bacterium]|nr:M28 family peptidase [Bacteroidales bacterium]
MMKIKYIWLFLAVCLLVSCDKSKNKDPETKPAIEKPAFDADSAFAFVKAQTDFGPRTPGSEAHSACAAYLKRQLSAFCDTVIVQPFTTTTYDGKKWSAQNIIGSFAPEKSKRVLLGAHWDSRPMADHDPDPEKRNQPIDGANDGASGVGVLLEVARQLQQKNPAVGVDIIFFDMEDYGTPSSENIPGDWWCLGAQYWTKNLHRPNYHADFGILLDMVGGENPTFYHEGFSSFYAQNIVSKVWGMAYRLGYGDYFINKGANPITDDHYYVLKNTGIRMIDIIHQDDKTGTGFGYVWHTMQDNISHIRKESLAAVGTTVLAVIYDEKE